MNPSLHRDPFDGRADEPLDSLIAAEEAAGDAGENDLEASINVLTMLWSMGRIRIARTALERERNAALREIEGTEEDSANPS